MDIRGRRSIYDNTSQINNRIAANHNSPELSENTSFENDESLELELESDNELISNSPKPNRKSKTQSPSPAGKGHFGVLEAQFIEENVSSSQINSQTTTKMAEEEEITNKRSNRWIFIIAVGAVAVAVTVAVINKKCPSSDKRSDKRSGKQCTFSNLRVKYENEDNYMWTHLTSGIENILNDRSDKPAVYLLVHSGGKKSKELIKDIAKTSSSCFDSSLKPVELEKFDFISEEAVNDYGYVIEKFKQKIQNGNVILIANLNEIPAEAAKALHAICDIYSPIVPKAVIFLSLMADHKGERAIDTAQEVLRELWQPTMSLNELDPLIARVTDEVILLQSK